MLNAVHRKPYTSVRHRRVSDRNRELFQREDINATTHKPSYVAEALLWSYFSMSDGYKVTSDSIMIGKADHGHEITQNYIVLILICKDINL